MAISNAKRKNLTSVMNKINKKFGEGSVNFVKDIEEKLKVRYLRTPSHEVNIMLNGGLGLGRIIELFGENASGKTTLLIETIAKNQKENPDFVAGWFETERSVDEEQLKAFGIDMDRLVYWDQSEVGAEQGFDILRGLVASGEFDLIAVNSVAGLAPKIEIEGEMDKANIAVTARLMSKLFRVVTGLAGKNNTTLVFINQTRTDVGKMFGDPTTTSGGSALGFYASQRINMRRLKLKAADPISADEGLKISAKTVKNRLTDKNPFTKCEYYAIYGEGIDTKSEIPDILEREGVVRKCKAWYYLEDEQGKVKNIGGIECKFRSKATFVKALKDNEVFATKLEDILNDILFNKSSKSISMDINEIREAENQNKKIEETISTNDKQAEEEPVIP